jgi:ribosome-associated protein
LAKKTKDTQANKREKEWLIFIAKFLYLKKVEDITILQLNKPDYIVDYFIIGTVQSQVQASVLIKELRRISKNLDMPLYNVEGGENSRWIVFNWGFCALHLFTKELREYYNLEDLWIDAKSIYWKNAKLTYFEHPRKFI